MSLALIAGCYISDNDSGSDGEGEEEGDLVPLAPAGEEQAKVKAGPGVPSLSGVGGGNDDDDDPVKVMENESDSSVVMMPKEIGNDSGSLPPSGEVRRGSRRKKLGGWEWKLRIKRRAPGRYPRSCKIESRVGTRSGTGTREPSQFSVNGEDPLALGDKDDAPSGVNCDGEGESRPGTNLDSPDQPGNSPGEGKKEAFKCPYCSDIFMEREGFIDHLTTHSQAASTSGPSPTNDSEPVINDPDPDPVPENLAPPSSGALGRGHGSINHPGRTCHICNTRFSYSRSLKRHIQDVHEDTDKPWKCPQCPSFFHGRGKLSLHMNLHTDSNRPWKCSRCPSYFNNLVTLRVHEARHHNVAPGRGGFFCQTCGKRVDRWSYLEAHMRSAHRQPLKWTPGLEWSCRISPGKADVGGPNPVPANGAPEAEARAGSGSPSTLKKRLKSFYCSICKLPMGDAYKLRNHMRMHQWQNNTSWKCARCLSFFSRRCYLVAHDNRAHGGKHRLTERREPSKPKITGYVQTDDATNPFSCTTCGLKFNRRSSAWKHAHNKHPNLRLRRKSVADADLEAIISHSRPEQEQLLPGLSDQNQNQGSIRVRPIYVCLTRWERQDQSSTGAGILSANEVEQEPTAGPSIDFMEDVNGSCNNDGDSERQSGSLQEMEGSDSDHWNSNAQPVSTRVRTRSKSKVDKVMVKVKVKRSHRKREKCLTSMEEEGEPSTSPSTAQAEDVGSPSKDKPNLEDIAPAPLLEDEGRSSGSSLARATIMDEDKVASADKGPTEEWKPFRCGYCSSSAHLRNLAEVRVHTRMVHLKASAGGTILRFRRLRKK